MPFLYSKDISLMLTHIPINLVYLVSPDSHSNLNDLLEF